MFATLNLQLMPNASLDTTGDSPVSLRLPAGELPEGDSAGFAQLLRFQSGNGELDGFSAGDFLPEDGNILPPPAELVFDEPLDTEWQLPLSTGGEAPAAADALVPAWVPALPVNNGETPAASIRKGVAAIPQDVSEPGNTGSAKLPELQMTVLQGPGLDVATQTSQNAAQSNAAVVALASNQPRELLPTERTRNASEVAIGSLDATDGLRSGILPESDRVPRVMAAPEIPIVPDRANPANAAASTATLASAIHQVTGAVGRESVAGELLSTDLVRTPVTDPAWGDRIGQRVVMMASNQLQQAEIRLTPAELGPVRVQIAVEDGATNITFQAQHAVTREAIEAAMPRLREMLAESGLSLGQANVSGDSVAEGQRDRREAASASDTVESEAELVDERQSERQKTVTSDGLIDTFA